MLPDASRSFRLSTDGGLRNRLIPPQFPSSRVCSIQNLRSWAADFLICLLKIRSDSSAPALRASSRKHNNSSVPERIQGRVARRGSTGKVRLAVSSKHVQMQVVKSSTSMDALVRSVASLLKASAKASFVELDLRASTSSLE